MGRCLLGLDLPCVFAIKCYTNFSVQTQKCLAVFATQKILPCVALEIATQTLGIGFQIHKCLAVFATFNKGQKSNTGFCLMSFNTFCIRDNVGRLKH